jgi:hypothetical protein
MSVKEPNPSRVTLTPAQQQMVIDAAADLPLPKQTLLLSRVIARLSYVALSSGYGPIRVSDTEVERAIVIAAEGLRHRLGA